MASVIFEEKGAANRGGLMVESRPACDYAAATHFPDDSVGGIHGTDARWLILGGPSLGCIRLSDGGILQLKLYVAIGAALDRKRLAGYT